MRVTYVVMFVVGELLILKMTFYAAFRAGWDAGRKYQEALTKQQS